jgi:hypothetical protein
VATALSNDALVKATVSEQWAREVLSQPRSTRRRVRKVRDEEAVLVARIIELDRSELMPDPRCVILLLTLALTATLLLDGAAYAQLPSGFTDHGIAAPVGMSAWGGTVATEDADGSRLVFVKLWAGGSSTTLSIRSSSTKALRMSGS